MVTPHTLLLLALLLPFAVPDETQKAIDDVTRAWKGGVTAERFAALSRLAAHDDPRCVDTLLEVIERGEVAMFPAARRVLGGYHGAETQARLVKLGLKHRDAAVREQALLAVGEGRPGGLDWRAVARAALDDPNARVRAAAVHSLGRARDGERLDRILALAADPDERVRQEVPAALGRLAGSRALATLLELAADPRWRVRLAAAQALADLRDPAAVVPLVEALGRERGRLREDLLALLMRLTGRDHGLDIEAWLAFLRDAPPDFLKQGDAAALDQLLPPRYVTGALRYYGVGTLSRNFVLLTDLSGSMEAPLPARDPGAAATSRLAVAQDELLQLLDTLTPEERFDLVTFRDGARAWRGQLVPADARQLAAARREVNGWSADGATNIHAALAHVLDQAERALDSPATGIEDVDTLFLLSDGAPSAGDVRDAALLLEYVAERNRTLHLRIHCVSLAGEAEARAFLQRLAALGTGHYVELAAAP